MTKSEVLALLGIKDSRFYVLLARYRDKPKEFSVTYSRIKATRHLPLKVVKQIRRELETERGFVNNPNMPIMFYNYSAIRDAVYEETGHNLSAQTGLFRIMCKLSRDLYECRRAISSLVISLRFLMY